MQLTAAAVTPPAEHAARRPAGEADAAAADADVRPAGGIMRRIIATLLGALLVYVAACDENDPYEDCFEYSYIDTVLVGDTIQNDELAQIVHVYPVGCNDFERFESSERGDTLALAALYHFHFSYRPCAHGSGLDTTYYSLHFSASGARYLHYRKSETTKIAQPVYVEE
jgi:hypothetical protein